MPIPDEIFVIHRTDGSLAFLDLFDAYAYANTLPKTGTIRIFYEMQEELTKTGHSELLPGVTITKHVLAKPRSVLWTEV